MSAIFAQRLTGPLASLATWRHVHITLKSQQTRDWCVKSSVWDPQVDRYFFKDELEKIQTRAARVVSGNYETSSMTDILEQLKWESLKKRRKDSRLIMLYKGLKGAASIPTHDLGPKNRRTIPGIIISCHFKHH